MSLLLSTHVFASYSEIDFAADFVDNNCIRANVRKILDLCSNFASDQSLNFTDSLLNSGCPQESVANLTESCLLSQPDSENTVKIITTVGVGCAAACTFVAAALDANKERGVKRLALKVKILEEDYQFMVDLSQGISNRTFQHQGQISISEVSRLREDNYNRFLRTKWEDKLFLSFKKSDLFKETCLNICYSVNNQYAFPNNNPSHFDRCLEDTRTKLADNLKSKMNKKEGTHGLHWFTNSQWIPVFLKSTGAVFPTAVTIYLLWK